jgi:hypothetical protein
MQYTVTDVLDLHVWMRDALAAHPLFERVDGGELEDCPVLKAAMVSFYGVFEVVFGGKSTILI